MLDTQRRIELGRSACRQSMVGACDIVTDRFGGIGSQENRPGMLNLWEQLHRVGRDHFEVLWRNLIHQIDCFIHRSSHDNRTSLFDRLACNLLSGERSEIGFHFVTHTICQLAVRRDQYGTRHLIMFRLGEQIDCQKILPGAFIRQNTDLAGPCDHIDIDFTVDQFLCRCYENISRTCNHIHFGNRLRSVCHRPDSGSTANFEYLCHSAEMAGGKQQLINLVIGSRCTDDDLLDTGYDCRNGVHQQ